MGLLLYGIFNDVLSDLKVISGSNYIFDVVERYLISNTYRLKKENCHDQLGLTTCPICFAAYLIPLIPSYQDRVTALAQLKYI